MYGISGFDVFFVCNFIHINTKKIDINFFVFACMYFSYFFVCDKKVPIKTNTKKITKRGQLILLDAALGSFVLLPPSKI